MNNDYMRDFPWRCVFAIWLLLGPLMVNILVLAKWLRK